MSSNKLINIAPKANVTFSSFSQWSKPDDAREILTAEHNRPFSFHTLEEEHPWIELDLQKKYPIQTIILYNRTDGFQFKAYSLNVQISSDKIEYEYIHKGFIVWNNKIEFNVDGRRIARFIKLSLSDKNYFHLHKIDVFVDNRYVDSNDLIFDDSKISSFIKYNFFMLVLVVI